MKSRNMAKQALLVVALASLVGCGGVSFSNPSNLPDSQVTGPGRENRRNVPIEQRAQLQQQGGTIWDIFRNNTDPNVTLAVNKYIWNATLDVLDFMPVQAADPFTGLIVFGYGAPPGSGRAYRATVYVQDPALDARSLRVALATRSGAASLDTVRAIEDAILTRARQLRAADEQL